MMSPEILLVGKILRCHGVKGKVLVRSMTDFPERFEPGSRLLLGHDESDLVPVVVVASSIHKGQFLVTLSGTTDGSDVDDRELMDPRTLEGKSLFIPGDDLVDTEEGEYYYHELIGGRVESADGDEIGVVDTVIRAGAQDLLVLDARERGEVFIPVVPSMVKSVDPKSGIIVVDLPDGLLDINNTKCLRST